MQSHETVSEPIDRKGGRKYRFTSAKDARNRKVRGLWQRGERFYAQIRVAVRLQLAGLDWTRVAIAKIESQIKKLNDAELFTIARVLNVRMDELFPNAEKVKRFLVATD